MPSRRWMCPVNWCRHSAIWQPLNEGSNRDQAKIVLWWLTNPLASNTAFMMMSAKHNASSMIAITIFPVTLLRSSHPSIGSATTTSAVTLNSCNPIAYCGVGVNICPAMYSGVITVMEHCPSWICVVTKYITINSGIFIFNAKNNAIMWYYES